MSAVSGPPQFAWTSRVLHWLMAAMVIAMLYIGVGMMASLAGYHRLVAVHRPLGIAVLALAVVRFINRRLMPLPDFLPTVSLRERVVVTWSERLLYALMFAQPLVGWGMLSAERYPIVLVDALHLPPILPHSLRLYELLRTAHTVLGYLFFAMLLAHLSGVLLHTIVLRDGLLWRMVPWAVRRRRTRGEEERVR
jgi:cytochrome b561